MTKIEHVFGRKKAKGHLVVLVKKKGTIIARQ